MNFHEEVQADVPIGDGNPTEHHAGHALYSANPKSN
jgi:hypothetical protein